MRTAESETASAQLRAALPHLDEIEIAALARLAPTPLEIQLALLLAEKEDPPPSDRRSRVAVVTQIYEAVRRHQAPPDDRGR